MQNEPPAIRLCLCQKRSNPLENNFRVVLANFRLPMRPGISELFSMNITMNLNRTRRPLHPEPIPVENVLPARDRWVLVVTASYRCLGYQADGIWRDVMHGRRIRDSVVGWLPMDDLDVA